MPETNGQVHSAILGLHAQTSLHPGSGTALGTVDLPVQRERHTLWPTIPGSASRAFSATPAATMSRPSTEGTAPRPTAKTVASRPPSARRPRVPRSTPVR